jgi:UDP-N-acetylmuramate dehydrogenase
VGAAPMQNIGAYGVETKDVFVELEALNLENFEIEIFDRDKCNFGYRESYFKHEGKGKYVILNVSFELSKKPVFNVSYGAIKDTLDQMNIKELSVKAISDAVIAIRKSKLPDPAEIGNSGSFFKNPEISKSQYEIASLKFPTMPHYVIDEQTVKVPAGWLIEQAGWKGKRIGEIGVHTQQALVLVNYGEGKGQEIADLAYEIQASVFDKFGIKITPEVNFIS